MNQNDILQFARQTLAIVEAAKQQGPPNVHLEDSSRKIKSFIKNLESSILTDEEVIRFGQTVSELGMVVLNDCELSNDEPVNG